MQYATSADLARYLAPDSVDPAVTLTRGTSSLTLSREGSLVTAMAHLEPDLLDAPWGGTIPEGYRPDVLTSNTNTESGYYLVEYGIGGVLFNQAAYTQPTAAADIRTIWRTVDAMPPGVTPEPPPNAGVLVREASMVVSDALRLVRYAVDAEGLPSSVRQREAVRDATCAQAAAWLAAGIDPLNIGGASDASGGRRVSSKAAGGLSVSYVASPQADAARDALVAGGLVPAAWRYLSRAGLERSTAVDIGSALVGIGGGAWVERTFDPTTGRLDP